MRREAQSAAPGVAQSAAQGVAQSETQSVALTIAGSDPSAGAGVHADLATFSVHGVYGTAVTTAITAQNSRGVRDAWVLSAETVRAQIDAVLEDFDVAAVKIGMLGNAAIVQEVAAALSELRVPIVLDPILVSTSGHRLLDLAGTRALLDVLLPLGVIVTPNRVEAGTLASPTLDEGRMIESAAAEKAVVASLMSRGALSVVLKGGHGTAAEVHDRLFMGVEPVTFSRPRLETTHTHGTGCAFASALAARLARGESLVAATKGAGDYVHAALAAPPGFGSENGPVGLRAPAAIKIARDETRFDSDTL